MGGGYQLLVKLSNFVMTYDLSDLSIRFGTREGIVLQLEQSNSIQTILRALVPAGDPGTVPVIIVNQNHQQNSAAFGFEYIDDRIPEVENFFPIQVYADGGHPIQVTIVKFPDGTGMDEVSIEMEDLSSGQSLGSPFQPEMIEMNGVTKDGHARTRVTFLTQAQLAVKDGLVKVQITVRGKYIDFELDYKAVPIGPAIISAVKPIEVMCTDTGQRVSIEQAGRL